MSLKRKEFQTQQQQQGLRVAAGDPHLVSLGGGRLSTAVTIHHLPIGELPLNLCLVLLSGLFAFPSDIIQRAQYRLFGRMQRVARKRDL